MTIPELLQTHNCYISFPEANRRLYWDEFSKEWVVIQFKPKAKHHKELERTTNEAVAVAALIRHDMTDL